MNVRRVLKIVAGIGGAFVVVAGAGIGAMAFSMRGGVPLMDGLMLPGGAVQLQQGIVSSFIVPTGNGDAIAIDCGQDKEAKPIKDWLSSHNLKLTAALITHAHGDHTGGCAALGVPLVALEAERAGLWGDKRFHGTVTQLMPPSGQHLKIARVAADGELLTFGEKTVRGFAIPGHTPGSAAWLMGGVLFLGDAVKVGTDGRVHEAPRFFADDPDQNLASVRALAARLRTPPPQEGAPVAVLAPAHSGPLSGVDVVAALAAID